MLQKQSLIIVYPNQFGYHTDSYKYCQYLPDTFQITYICFDQGFEKLELPGIRVVYAPNNIGKLNRLIKFFQMVFQICHQQPDNILITIQFKFSFLIGLFANSRRKILDYRTGDLNANLLKRRFYNCLMLFDSFFFQYNSVISNGLRKQLGIKQKGTLILPLGADVISQTKHTYEKLHLLYVGSLNRRNIYQTIEGLALFIKSNPDFRNIIKYTIIGFGSEIEVLQIKNTILKNDLRGTVEYLGRKKYTELPYYFSMCNIGISYVPITSFYEHQPVTKTFEYALSGLFCIATDTYENRAVITPKNGLLCNDNPESFATSLQQVFDIRNTLDEEGIRNSLKEYHWRKIVKEKLEPFLR